MLYLSHDNTNQHPSHHHAGVSEALGGGHRDDDRCPDGSHRRHDRRWILVTGGLMMAAGMYVRLVPPAGAARVRLVPPAGAARVRLVPPAGPAPGVALCARE